MNNKNNPLYYISKFVEDVLKDFQKTESAEHLLPMDANNPPISDTESPASPEFGFFSTSKTPKNLSPRPGMTALFFTTDIQARFETLEQQVMPMLLSSHEYYYEEFRSLALRVSHLITLNEKQKIFGLIEEAKKNKEEANNNREYEQSCNHDIFLKWKDKIISEEEGLRQYNSHPSMTQLHHDNPHHLKILLELYIYQLLFEKAYLSYLNLPHDAVFRKLFDQGFALYVCMQLKKDIVITGMLSALADNEPISVKYCNEYGKLIEDMSSHISIRQAMMEQPAQQNAKRLALGRVRRFYLSLNAFSMNASSSWVMIWLEPVFRVVMSWLNFIFFLPRILIGLTELITHTFLLGEHTDEERKLAKEIRFMMFFSRRWEILTRDSAWMFNGFLSLFVLVGGLGFWSLYVNAFIQLLEVFLNIFLLGRFEEHQKEMNDYFTEQSEQIEKEIYTEFFEDFSSRMSLEYENRSVRLINSILILIGSVMIVPTMAAISPIIPLVGAIISLSVSIFHFIYFPDWEDRRRQKLDPMMLSTDELSGYLPTKYDSLDFINIFTEPTLKRDITNANLYIP